MGITLFMIEEKIARLEEVRDANGALTDVWIRVDREALVKHGKQSMGKLLVRLQVPKSIADGEGARQFYEALTTPPASWDGELRDFVLSKRLVRLGFRPFVCYVLTIMFEAAARNCAAHDCDRGRKGGFERVSSD